MQVLGQRQFDVVIERDSEGFYVASVPQLAGWGLVDRALAQDGRVVLTQRGRLMADAVVRELLA